MVKHFGDLADPGNNWAKRHELLDITVIILCAVVCGTGNWVEIEEFGKAKQDWFAGFLKLPNGIPSHDAFGCVLSVLNPEQFPACFAGWPFGQAQMHRKLPTTGGQPALTDANGQSPRP